MSGAVGGKRPSGGDSPPGPPEKKSKKEEKTTTTLIEPIRIAGVSSTVSFSIESAFTVEEICQSSLTQSLKCFFSYACAGRNGHESSPVQEQEVV